MLHLSPSGLMVMGVERRSDVCEVVLKITYISQVPIKRRFVQNN